MIRIERKCFISVIYQNNNYIRKISIIPICISMERRINIHMHALKAVYHDNLTFRSARSKSHDTCPDIQEQIVSL